MNEYRLNQGDPSSKTPLEGPNLQQRKQSKNRMNIFAIFFLLVVETTAFSLRPALPIRQFQPIVSRTQLRNTGVEIPITEELECCLTAMYKQSTVWSLVAVATELIRPSLPGSPFVRHLLPLYVQAALTGDMRSPINKT